MRQSLLHSLPYKVGTGILTQPEYDVAQNGRNNFEYSGNYTVTVRSNGFKTISKTFNVSDGKDVPTSNQIRTMSSFDAVSMATSGGSSDGSGDSSGSYSVSADLFFNSDLLANALILDKLNIENKGAKTVVDYWYNTILDAVLNKGETTYYTSSGYLDAVNDAKVSGKKWLAFGEYVKSDNAKTTPNRPYSVKEVLEDGLLGEIQYSSSTCSKFSFFFFVQRQFNDLFKTEVSKQYPTKT